MAYADQQMSGSRMVAIGLVILIHLAIGYALITGLAYQAFEKAVERVTTVDITEEPHAGGQRDLLVSPCDRFDRLVVGSDPEADQAIRNGEPVEDVDGDVARLEQGFRGVKAGGA